MLGPSRARITLDPRGLGPAIRAYGEARDMTVSAVVRSAVSRMLEEAGVAPVQPADANPVAVAGHASVTVRISRAVAQELDWQARAAGLSRSGYLTRLIAGERVQNDGIDRKHVVKTLACSTDQLALMIADLGEFARLARRGALPSSDQVDGAVTALAREVRAHLALASRLMADMQPGRRIAPGRPSPAASARPS